MSSELTVFTLFGPGRSEAIGIWRKSISNLQAPQGAHFLMLDNTNGELTGELSDMAGRLIGDGYDAELLTYDKQCRDLHPIAITQHIVDLWRFILPHIKGDYVLSLEHDVEVPPGAYRRLKGLLDERKERGAMGLMLRSRQALHSMAFHLQAFEPYTPSLWGIDSEDVKAVGLLHTGCVLYRTQALKCVRPRRLTEGCCSHEYAICYDLQRNGWEIWQDGLEPKAKHYQSATEFV